MASWFTRALDRITPWNRGGEVQRRQESQERRKRKEEEEAQFAASQTGAPQVRTNIPFTAGNKGFDLTSLNSSFNNRVSVPQVQDYSTLAIDNKPKQSLLDKVRDQFDTNTPADQYRRQKGNIEKGENKDIVVKNAPNAFERYTAPIRSAFRVTTGIGQGAAGLYDLVTPGKGESRATKYLTRMAEKLDEDAKRQNLESLYKTGNVVGEIGSYFTPGVLSKGGKIGGFTSKAANRVDDALRLGDDPGRIRRLVSEASREFLDPVNLEQEARLTGRYLGQDSARGKEITPQVVGENVAQAFGGAFLSPLFRGLSRFIRRGNGEDLVDEAIDATTSATGTGVSQLDNVRRIPVGQDIPISTVDDAPVNIPVRNTTPQSDIIREIGGDAPNVVRLTPEQAIEERTAQRFRDQSFGRPDDRIEGVTPRNNEPFSLNSGDVKQSQDKVVEEYASLLKDFDDQATGGQIIPDGEGGYRRTSEHSKFYRDYYAENGRRPSKAAWREYARKQLESGRAINEVQKSFDDLSDAEVQSLLKNGEQVSTDPGRPVQVKQVDSIPVIDESVSPVDLPETPGRVRVTSKTDPIEAKTKAVANQPTVAPIQKNELLPDVPATTVDNSVKVPGGDLSEAFDSIVKGLKDNQKAYQVEKKLTKAEKSRRFANYRRIYDEARASGSSSQEAEAMARKALGGSYTKNTVGNVEISQANRDALFDKVSQGDDGLNTKKAFEHMFNPERTEPLRNWERTRIRRFIQKELGEEAAQALDEAIVAAEQAGDRSSAGRVADFMTSAIAAGDLSAVGRQGLSGLLNHPRMSKQAWDNAARTVFNPEKYDQFVADLANDADTAFIQENMGGKYLTLADVADEGRGPDTTNRAISWYVDPSNRHYNTYLDSLRHQQKKAIIERYGGQEGFLKAAQAANPEDPQKWMKAWNNVIDRQSGRGSFSNAGSPTAGDVQVLFSARNLASKFQRLSAPLQLKLLKTNPDAYLYQLKETATQAAALGATLAAIGASGIADIEDGKIKIGNTRVDITGGFSTIINSMNNVRQAMGIMHDNSEGGSFGRSGLDVTQDFLQNQLSPVLGTVGKLLGIDLSKGEDKYGNKLDASWWAGAAPLPAVAQTVIDSAVEGENPLETARNVAFDAFGFNTNTYQSAGDKDNAARAETADSVNSGLQEIQKTGLLTDKMIADIDDEDVRDILTGKSDKQLSEDELGKVRNKLVEGISTATGSDSDSAYRERGEYDKDIAALKLKKQIIESEPNFKPSDVKGLDIQIKRSELLNSKNVPFELLDAYQGTTLTEWRNMEEDDPEMFQKLWALDELFAKEGVSYKSGDFNKQKYYQKKSGSGRGGRGSRKVTTDFGKIGGFRGAPTVRAYDSIDIQSGAVPRIAVQRPNIVHKIGTRG